ncbi:MAG: enoyl-ACP reductase FabI [Actinomycetota bacterium]|nr:enoyl-ACP reductase FabI [Actinomycetota bacterium]
MLEGKRILVTGVVNRRSIAFAVAERAQQLGAEVILTSFGRVRRMTERAAGRLPESVDLIELDINSDADLEALPAAIAAKWDGVDGVLHAIANAPADALGGNFMSAPRASATQAFETSAYSFKSLARAVQPLLGTGAGGSEDGAGHGGSLVGLDFDAAVAWPSYDWMGVAKAALESTSRYLARDLGPAGHRVNLVSAGPIRTAAAGGIPGFSDLAGLWEERAPLGWQVDDPYPVADTVCFLFSDLSRAISGEIIHVDGGFHAVGA